MPRIITDADAPPAHLLISNSGAGPAIQPEPVELLPHQAAAVSQFSGVAFPMRSSIT